MTIKAINFHNEDYMHLTTDDIPVSTNKNYVNNEHLILLALAKLHLSKKLAHLTQQQIDIIRFANSHLKKTELHLTEQLQKDIEKMIVHLNDEDVHTSLNKNKALKRFIEKVINRNISGYMSAVHSAWARINTLNIDGALGLRGPLTLLDGARVKKYITIKAEAFKVGSTAPTATTIGSFSVLQFAGVGAVESIYTSFHVPTSWIIGTDIGVHIHWAPINANAGTVVWQMTWNAVASEANEIISGAGTTIFVADASQGLQDEQLETENMLIAGTSLELKDSIGIRIFRDPAHGSDNYASTASFILLEIYFIAGNLGETV